MVTSTKLPEKKVVKMSEQNRNVVVRQRTLLGEVNAHLTCYICRGYYIDATTIVECLHSFCRSCIIKHLQVKSYCPVCEMMINSAKPNIKPDKALQDIVYKLVPGLFQREMERRQQFYASRPGHAASATPEQRGEDTERIIFSPEDVISFSLEYADATDIDSISSKSSDSNEQHVPSATTRRYLQCPAVVNISHLKKFLSMKFDIDSTQFSIDILYKRVQLPDYYTLMDIAYIYNWKRNEPMRFFYQIIDYIAIRNRYGLFDIDRKGSHFRDRKSSPTLTEDTNVSSPAPHMQEHGSEESTGAESPIPDDSNVKKNCITKKDEKQVNLSKDPATHNVSAQVESTSMKKNCDEDVEKSQFLNSFELTAKNSCSARSPVKPQGNDESERNKMSENLKKESKSSPMQTHLVPKHDDNILKRKINPPPTTSTDVKKVKIDKPCSSAILSNPVLNIPKLSLQHNKLVESSVKSKGSEMLTTQSFIATSTGTYIPHTLPKDLKSNGTTAKQVAETLKRSVPVTSNVSPPKRKTQESTPVTTPTKSLEQNSESPKHSVTKSDSQMPVLKPPEAPKPVIKRMPELKLGIPSTSLMNQNKGQIVNKVRMDLLANNCDPTMDRSKILSQVKNSLAAQSTGQMTGDPLKSLFDSCKINIPSSLSITLTDQKLDQRNVNDNTILDTKKSLLNKNSPVNNTNNTGLHKVPSLPVHNYIEILKLPDVDTKKPQTKTETIPQLKPNPTKKPDTPNQTKSISTNKPLEPTSAKGPIPSLKPIGETKLGKQGGIYSMTSPYQQKYIQSLEQSEKSKLPKTKMQVPKLMPATPKTLNTVSKDSTQNKPSGNTTTSENKIQTNRSDNVLDLSTTHNVQSQLGPQQTKTFETMQTIANLAKKQSLSNKGTPINMSQNSPYSSMTNRSLPSESPALRTSSSNLIKTDKVNLLNTIQSNNARTESVKTNSIRQMSSSTSNSTAPNYQVGHSSPNTAQPSPRSQTRSPSSSPKLVIAEDKQTTNNTESNVNQSNQISSTQISSTNLPKSDSLKQPLNSKVLAKPIKALPPTGKLPNIRQSIPPNMKPGPSMNTPSDILLQPQMIPQTFLRQMEWLKNHQARQYENLLKNMSNVVHQTQKDLNKDTNQ